ncbi:MAG: sigma factor-like helix-turn-helix DNA-binding protein [Prevotella sp.]
MEGIEFYVRDGIVYYSSDGRDRKLDKTHRGIIEAVLKYLGEYRKETLNYLRSIMSDSKGKYEYEFDIVERFLRCNCGELDKNTYDLEYGLLNTEDVHCPLRGICKEEKHVCSVKTQTGIKGKAKRILKLYGRGFSQKEIAELTDTAVSTVNNHLAKLKKKLHLGKGENLRVVVNNLNL